VNEVANISSLLFCLKKLAIEDKDLSSQYLDENNLGYFVIGKNVQQERQCTCNVTMSRMRETIVAVEEQ
jgi:hypothetical protein